MLPVLTCSALHLHLYLHLYLLSGSGGSTSSVGIIRKFNNETNSVEERIQSVINCNSGGPCTRSPIAEDPQQDQFSTHMYLNATHMRVSKYALDLFNSSVFEKMKTNPNIPYVKDLYWTFVL